MAHAKRNPCELRWCILQSACRINRELVSWEGKKRPTTAHFARLLSHAREKKKPRVKPVRRGRRGARWSDVRWRACEGRWARVWNNYSIPRVEISPGLYILVSLLQQSRYGSSSINGNDVMAILETLRSGVMLI